MTMRDEADVYTNSTKLLMHSMYISSQVYTLRVLFVRADAYLLSDGLFTSFFSLSRIRAGCSFLRVNIYI